MTDQKVLSGRVSLEELQTRILRKLHSRTFEKETQAKLKNRFVDREGYDHGQYDEAIRALEQKGYIVLTGPPDSGEVRLLPKGGEAWARSAGLATQEVADRLEETEERLEETEERLSAVRGELRDLNEGASQLRQQTDNAAKAIDAALAKAEAIDAALAKAVNDNKEAQNALKKAQEDLQDRLDKGEREFYSKLVPFFGGFISVFALIITTAQRLQGTAYTLADDPWQVASLSTAIVVPLASILLVFVVLIWLAVWLATRRPRSRPRS
jgi:uncharacterized phage infection (PIP) family protein YhgE